MQPILLAVALFGEPKPARVVLKAPPARAGRLRVTDAQISFIRAALNSKNRKRILDLVHPIGCKRRYVWYAYESSSGTSVRREHYNKDYLAQELTRDLEPDSLGAMLGLTPQGFCPWKRKSGDTWVTNPFSEGPQRLRPIHYVRLWRKDGRLWIGEFGWGHGEAE